MANQGVSLALWAPLAHTKTVSYVCSLSSCFINWPLCPIFTSGTNHSKDYNQRFRIIHVIQSKGKSRNWGESLSNGRWADEKIGWGTNIGSTWIMLATLNQLHTYLVDTSPSQTGNNEDIDTCIHGHWQQDLWEYTVKNALNIWHPPFHGGGRQCPYSTECIVVMTI